MERKVWRDNVRELYLKDATFHGLVDMIERALHAGVIDVEMARAAGMIAVNNYAMRSGLMPMLLVTMPPGTTEPPEHVTVDGVVYRADPEARGSRR